MSHSTPDDRSRYFKEDDQKHRRRKSKSRNGDHGEGRQVKYPQMFFFKTEVYSKTRTTNPGVHYSSQAHQAQAKQQKPPSHTQGYKSGHTEVCTICMFYCQIVQTNHSGPQYYFVIEGLVYTKYFKHLYCMSPKIKS